MSNQRLWLCPMCGSGVPARTPETIWEGHTTKEHALALASQYIAGNFTQTFQDFHCSMKQQVLGKSWARLCQDSNSLSQKRIFLGYLSVISVISVISSRGSQDLFQILTTDGAVFIRVILPKDFLMPKRPMVEKPWENWWM